MADKRAYAKFDVGYMDNPKLVAMLDALPLAVLMHCKSVLYAAQHLTDGHVPPALIRRHVGGTEEDINALIERGLWHRKGHECKECPQPSDQEIYVHDYLEHNRSKDDYNRLARRGKKAAEARWSDAPSNATSMQNPMPRREEKRRDIEGSSKRHRLRDDFTPSEAHVTKAKELGLNLANELERFKNHFIGNGDTKVDWGRTFSNWLSRSKDFNPGQASAESSNYIWR